MGGQTVISTDVSRLTNLPNYLLFQLEMFLYTGEERLPMVLVKCLPYTFDPMMLTSVQ